MNSDAYTRQGEALLAEAEVIATKSTRKQASPSLMSSLRSFFSGLTSAEASRYELEEAAEKAERAGNAFKAAAAWQRASEAFSQAADYLERAGESDLAVRHVVEAASVVRRDDPSRSVELLKQAVEMYIHGGRFEAAARQERAIAELYAEALADPENAIVYYERAADRYLAENSPIQAWGIREKIAQMAAEVGHYGKAVAIWEELARTYARDATKQFAIRDLLFRAGLSVFANADEDDAVAIEKRLDRYANVHPAMEDSREFRLLRDIAAAVQADDADEFGARVAEFDKVHRLDAWKTAVLLAIRKTRFEAEPDLT